MSKKIKTAFHPGAYLSEYIEEMQITQSEFAQRLGITKKQVSLIISEKANITPDIASKLAKLLGTSIEVWLNLQSRFDAYKEEIKTQENIKLEYDVYKLIDKPFLKQMHIIDDMDDKDVQIEKLRQSAMVSNLTFLKQADLLASYRTAINKEMEEKNIVCRNVWVSIALREAKKQTVGRFDLDKLKSHIVDFRRMTIEAPEIFYPKMLNILNECGVAFVLLPSLKNSNINGVVKWIDSENVMMALNTRGAYNDKFWFSFFHELGHVLQQAKRKPIIGLENQENDDELEMEADEFASQTLIDSDDLKRIKNFTKYEIINFARKERIAPGIVVGRLQKLELIKYSYLNELKVKYEVVVD